MSERADTRGNGLGSRWCVGALGVVALAYVLTAAQHLTGTDNPEFVMLQGLGGVAHSPGYPAYVLYLRAMAWMPGVTAAHAAALSTACLGIGCVAALWKAARAWGASRAGATVAAVVTGLNTQVWHVHTHAEAFAFNDLCVGLLLWLCAPKGPLRGAQRVAASGLVAGVALGNHHTAVLLAPIGLWAVWMGLKESSGFGRSSGLVLGVLGLVLGLGSYGYLLWVDPQTQWVWGRFEGLEEVLSHFLRAEYGTGKLGPGGGPDPLTHIPHLLGQLVLDGVIVGPALAAWGAREVFASGAPGDEGERSVVREDVGWWRALAVAWLLCGPVFVGLFNMAPHGASEVVVARFHVMPALMFAPWIGRGWDAIWPRVVEARRQGVVVVGLGVVACVALGLGVTRTQRHYGDAIEVYARGVLESAPRDAVLLGTGTSRYLGTEYMRRIEGTRQDVLVLEAHMLGREWFVERARARSGLVLPMPGEVDGVKRVDVVEVVRVVRASGRPVLLTDRFSEKIEAAYALEPAAMGWLVVEQGSEPDAKALGDAARAALALDAPAAMPRYEEHPWGWVLYAGLGRLWEDARARCGGAPECAGAIEEAARRFSPPE